MPLANATNVPSGTSGRAASWELNRTDTSAKQSALQTVGIVAALGFFGWLGWMFYPLIQANSAREEAWSSTERRATQSAQAQTPSRVQHHPRPEGETVPSPQAASPAQARPGKRAADETAVVEQANEAARRGPAAEAVRVAEFAQRLANEQRREERTEDKTVHTYVDSTGATVRVHDEGHDGYVDRVDVGTPLGETTAEREKTLRCLYGVARVSGVSGTTAEEFATFCGQAHGAEQQLVRKFGTVTVTAITGERDGKLWIFVVLML